MASDIDIVNAALSKLGERRILNFADKSPAGRIAARTYPDLRDAMLREFPWNFATTRAALSASTEAPAFGFAFAYPLPADLLRLIEVSNVDEEKWRNESGEIVTDKTAPLNIRYVARVLEGQMDATFREVLATRLALAWAESLSGTTSLTQELGVLYRNALQVARGTDGHEDQIQELEESSFILARF